MTSTGCSPDPGGLLLVLNGTGDRLQFLLAREEAPGPSLLCFQDWAVAGQSVRVLAPTLRQALTLFGADGADIRRIACVRGPGGFTGIRMALALAEGLAAGNTQVPVLRAGLDLLPLLAAGPAPLCSGILLPLTWSRRGQVYTQAFTTPDLAPLGLPQVLSLDRAADLARNLDGPVALLGNGLRRNREFFASLAATRSGLSLLGPQWDLPGPELLLAAAAGAAYADAPMEPLYLRASDAEDNIAPFAAARGLSPESARDLLTPGSSWGRGPGDEA